MQTGADLQVDPFIYARWGKQSYKTGNAVKCPHADLHSAKCKMKSDVYIFFFNKNGISPL